MISIPNLGYTRRLWAPQRTAPRSAHSHPKQYRTTPNYPSIPLDPLITKTYGVYIRDGSALVPTNHNPGRFRSLNGRKGGDSPYAPTSWLVRPLVSTHAYALKHLLHLHCIGHVKQSRGEQTSINGRPIGGHEVSASSRDLDCSTRSSRTRCSEKNPTLEPQAVQRLRRGPWSSAILVPPYHD